MFFILHNVRRKELLWHFFDFRIADKAYDVNDVTDNVNSTHDALVPLSAKARLYSLTRREGTDDIFVATIVGDECKVPAINKLRHTLTFYSISK